MIVSQIALRLLRLMRAAGRRRTLLVLLLPFAGVVTAFGIAPDTVTESVTRTAVIETVALPLAAPAAATVESQPVTTTLTFWREEPIQRGDTFAGVMARLRMNDAEALTFINSEPQAKPLFQLVPGRSLRAETSADGRLLTLYYLNGERSLTVSRHDEGYAVQDQPAALETRVVSVSGQINGSLFASTDALHIPEAITKQLVEIFSTEIDFHRGLRGDDRFTVIYEALHDRGEPAGAGRLLAAEFINRGKTHNIMWFEPNPGKPGSGAYFTLAGRDNRKAFLRSPLEFSRVSSGFSDERYHPLLNTWTAHKGVDFVAPLGTNIKATADGVVDFVGVQSGYGNVVILRHHNKYTTLYAHMADFAPDLKVGNRVQQGEVIGTVGMTGLTTGPHVHFEFRIDDVHFDPESVAMPTALPLAPDVKKKLQEAAVPLARTLRMLREATPSAFPALAKFE
jgi:murein DD-endopeptidase MepM/ murein hydrolase activator NlpD